MLIVAHARAADDGFGAVAVLLSSDSLSSGAVVASNPAIRRSEAPPRFTDFLRKTVF